MEILALLFLWVLLSGGNHQPKCPPLHYDKIPIYAPVPKSSPITSRSVTFKSMEEANEFIARNSKFATVTIDMKTGKTLGVKIGEKIDSEAVAYNKRVRECQTLNGEFT